MRTKRRKAERLTLAKAIAAATISGDKNAALDLAIYNRKPTALTELAREFYGFWQAKESSNPIFKRERKAPGFARWVAFRAGDLLVRCETGNAWYGPKFFDDFAKELRRVCKEDARAILFERPGPTKAKANNPNWFRQILLANLMTKKPHPLARIAKEYKIPVRTLRREVRKMGARRGKAGRPKQSLI